MSVDNYLGKHPGAATVSSALIEGVKDKRKGRRRNPAPALTTLSHDMMGVKSVVNLNIAESTVPARSPTATSGPPAARRWIAPAVWSWRSVVVAQCFTGVRAEQARTLRSPPSVRTPAAPP